MGEMAQENLTRMLSESSGLSMQTVGEILETVGSVWAEDLTAKGFLRIEGMGDLLVDHRSGRRGVNTETKELFIIPPQDYVLFMPSTALIDKMNGST